jgi:GPN-loop GTPase
MILLNKSDCTDSKRLVDWVNDYEAFMIALQEDSSYLATLSKSIIIHLSEFYEKLKYLCISAKTGAGLEKVL